MKRIAALIIFLLPGLAAAAEGTAGTAAAQPACAVQTQPGDKLDFSCPMAASGSAQTFRFKANFVGSHDDTTAELKATLDGAPLACSEESKTSTMAEDGEVSLECRASLTGKAGSKPVLGVALSWHHAQYVGFEFTAD